jgi:hypothetical protein
MGLDQQNDSGIFCVRNFRATIQLTRGKFAVFEAMFATHEHQFS